MSMSMFNSFPVYLQFVFAVKNSASLIPLEHKSELHEYISELVQNRSSKLLAVNSMPDHIHILIVIKSHVKACDLIKEIKVESGRFINQKKWLNQKFSWQEGYGVFFYAEADIDSVVKYIQHQEKHHAKKDFREEYIEILHGYDVKYQEKFVLETV
jgi:putative transposase